MADYIDKQKTLNVIFEIAENVINSLPSSDVVEVVRCKECKYRYQHECYGLVCLLDSSDPYDTSRNADDDNWYCADGERK